MTLLDRKQRLLQQRLANAGLLKSEQSLAASRPCRETHEGPTPLSSAQLRMWYHAQLAKGSTAYNFCVLLRPDPASPANLTHPLSATALTDALSQVVRRHEILRTRYRAGAAGYPEQIVEPFLPPRITEIDIDRASGDNSAALDDRLDALARQARDEPFDLEIDTPLRALLIRGGSAIVAVILVIPHIAGDGASFGTVLADLEKAYGQGKVPDALSPPSEIRYLDYALWERRHLGDPADQGSLHAKQLRFWGNHLAGLPVELSLPFDRPRPAVPSFAGSQLRLWLGPNLSNALRQTVKAHGVTPLVGLQSAVAVALGRFGAERDIPLGTPVDLRQDSTLDQVVGFFSNTVVVRVDLKDDPTFSKLLRHVHDRGLAALENRDVPFEKVVEHINPPRATARNPLFGVMVTATRPWPTLNLGGSRVTLNEPRQTQAKFDLTFVIHDEGMDGRVGVSLLYARDLFDDATARHLVELVIGILGQGVHHPDLRLSQMADFAHRLLNDGGAELAGRLAEHEGITPKFTTRAILLEKEARDVDIAAALAKLLARHDALRLRQDPENRRWGLANAADLWEKPILRRMPHPAGTAEIDGFLGWLRDASGENQKGVARVLELSAPSALLDDESWGVLLAELSPLRTDGGSRPPQAFGSYADWLNRTADLAASPDIVDHAEAWLDLFEAAEGRRPLHQQEPSDGQPNAVESGITLPTLGDWPDPVALRTAAVAALLWARRHSISPILIQVDEPDRDRSFAGAPDMVVGRCRRTVPLLVTPPQEARTARASSEPEVGEALLRAAREGLAHAGAKGVAGDLAVSYMLARDISPDVAGTFDKKQQPDITLDIVVTDSGDESEGMTSPPLREPEGEYWAIRFEPRSRRIKLTVRARRAPTDIRDVVEAWTAVFPRLSDIAVAETNGDRADEGALVALSTWDRQRLEETFGQLRDVMPLSPLQEGLRFHAIGATGGTREVYISQTSLDLHGEIDPERLHQAVLRAVDLTPSVTAGFAEIGGTMVQVIPTGVKVPWRSETASDARTITRIADEEYRAPFDAARPPLIRFALIRVSTTGIASFHRFLLTAHHILLDGWSIRLLFRLILRLYDEPAAIPAPPQFRRYLSWFTEQEPANAETVWRDVLAGVEPTILHPSARGLEASGERSEERTETVGPELTAALARLARSASTTLSTLLELAWGTLLIRLSGSPDVVFGNVVSGRPAEIEDVNEIIGLLFNTVPVRVRIQGTETVRSALRSLHQQKGDFLQHSYVNLTRLQKIAGQSPLFDTLFAVQNLPALDLPTQQNIRIENAQVRDATHYPLSMAVSPMEGAIQLRLMFRDDVVAPEQAEALIQAYINIFEAFVGAPDRPLLTVDALPRPNSLLPHSVAGEDLEIGNLSVSDLLIRQAEATPGARAVRAGDTELSFADLSAAANRLAHLLQARGVHPEHRVALLLPRSEVMIVALFGVFAAHAAYVPVDPATPTNRIRSMLDQSEPTVILTVNALKDRLPDVYGSDSRVIVLDDPAMRSALIRQPETAPRTERPFGLRHLAYVIFTSGSTGEPKGVAVPYLGLTNMFVNHKKAIFSPALAAQNARRLSIAHTTSFAFDASWEQLLWLLAGHEVHVIDDELRRDPDRLLDLFDDEQIDAFDVTPTYGEYLVEHGLLDRDRPQGRPGTGVVFVSLGGEAVGDALWTRLREAPGLGSYNLYGPTEYTINALGADLADSPDPTVGRPISNTKAYILGPGMLPAPVGVTGELYLGGVGLARGYVGRPAATAERFIADHLGEPGARLYRTGDLARWRPDGNIDFLGRSDDQLKIRGYRVEPAEVENALVATPGVKRAAVVGRPMQDGSTCLVAYVVCNPEAPDNETLRDLLRSRLPSYMVPSTITPVDDLPRTINGKLDVLALPVPTTGDNTTAPPVTATERVICDAFATVLERTQVGRFDDFFELGGHSLLTVRLMGELRDTISGHVSVRQIYDHPTPAALAASLEAEGSGAVDVPATRQDTEEADIARMLTDAVLPPDIAMPAPRVMPQPLVLAELDAVLLTGAAGFLGSHVLFELLHRTRATIHCLVRAQDVSSAQERVLKALASYGLWEDSFKHRIIGVPGDLTRPRLGLTAETFNALADQVDAIIHNGGATNEVDLYARLAETNVAGAKEVLRLAASGRRATPLHFVSTASVVARRGVNPAVITEDTRLTAQDVERTGYVQSKWVAEELMHKAAERGLPVTIHRPGRISGHSITGACSSTVGFWQFIRSILLLGAAPELRSDRLTLAPVDYVASALVALIERGDPGVTYHLSNRMQTSISGILEAARNAGYSLEVLPFDAWREKLARTAEEWAKQGDESLTPAMLLADHIDKYDGPEVESALGQHGIMRALAGSGIEPPPITDALLSRYIAYFKRVGFFPSRESRS